jgi:hypothetical protein
VPQSSSRKTRRRASGTRRTIGATGYREKRGLAVSLRPVAGPRLAAALGERRQAGPNRLAGLVFLCAHHRWQKTRPFRGGEPWPEASKKGRARRSARTAWAIGTPRFPGLWGYAMGHNNDHAGAGHTAMAVGSVRLRVPHSWGTAATGPVVRRRRSRSGTEAAAGVQNVPPDRRDGPALDPLLSRDGVPRDIQTPAPADGTAVQAAGCPTIHDAS